MRSNGYVLVVQDNVGPPDVIGRHVQHLHAAVLFGLPAEFVIEPRLSRVAIDKVTLVIVHIRITLCGKASYCSPVPPRDSWSLSDFSDSEGTDKNESV